jgi:hypothetical protein
MLLFGPDLRHQPLQRVTQMPLAEVELGVGEDGTYCPIEPGVVVAHDPRRSLLQRAQERFPVSLRCVGKGLRAPELGTALLKARGAEDPERDPEAAGSRVPHRERQVVQQQRSGGWPGRRSVRLEDHRRKDLNPVGHQLAVRSHARLPGCGGSARKRRARSRATNSRLAVVRPSAYRLKRLRDPTRDELIVASRMRSLGRYTGRSQDSSRGSTSVKRCGRSPFTGTQR